MTKTRCLLCIAFMLCFALSSAIAKNFDAENERDLAEEAALRDLMDALSDDTMSQKADDLDFDEEDRLNDIADNEPRVGRKHERSQVEPVNDDQAISYEKRSPFFGRFFRRHVFRRFVRRKGIRRFVRRQGIRRFVRRKGVRSIAKTVGKAVAEQAVNYATNRAIQSMTHGQVADDTGMEQK